MPKLNVSLIALICICVGLNICLIMAIILKSKCTSQSKPLRYKSQTGNSSMVSSGRKTARVIGGDLTDVSVYYYIAALVTLPIDKSYPTDSKLFCASCIISTHWVLSADHCIQYVIRERMWPENVGVVGNASKWKQGILHVAKKWVRREPHQEDFDVVLIKVSTPFTAKNERPIPIASHRYIFKKFQRVNVAGWGAIRGTQLVPTDTLRHISIVIFDDNDCKKIYNGVRKIDPNVPEITPRMFCAGPANESSVKDSCNYDSGGPIVDDHLLIGVVSFGLPVYYFEQPCGLGYPGVYARLPKFEDWIHGVETAEKEKIAEFKANPSNRV